MKWRLIQGYVELSERYKGSERTTNAIDLLTAKEMERRHKAENNQITNWGISQNGVLTQTDVAAPLNISRKTVQPYIAEYEKENSTNSPYELILQIRIPIFLVNSCLPRITRFQKGEFPTIASMKNNCSGWISEISVHCYGVLRSLLISLTNCWNSSRISAEFIFWSFEFGIKVALSSDL